MEVILPASVLLLAVLGANLPFLNQHLLGVIPVGRKQNSRKSSGVRLLELLLMYGMTGVYASMAEGHTGQVFSQGWQFYVITGCLFLVLAYPGFVWCYLRKGRTTYLKKNELA